jgi:hypothetical protein
MALWPTLLGVNLWLVALVVPLCLTARSASPLVFLAAALSPLCLLFGLRLKKRSFGQLMLLVGVPLLCLLPGADGALANPQLQPRPAVLLVLGLLIGYLVAVCRFLVLFAPTTSDRATTETELLPTGGAADKALRRSWLQTPLAKKSPSPRLRQRLFTHRLLIAYTVTAPLLLLYAIDLHPQNLRALRASFGPLHRVAAMEASLTAGITLLYSIAFYFCIMAPLASYLDHHRELRGELQAMRRRAKQGRPRVYLYLFMAGALLGMIGLLLLSLRR